MTPLAVVVVAYESADELEASLPPLVAQLRPADELVVVDNAPRRPVPPRPGVRVLPQRANGGFAGGARAGADATRADLLLFLNPDAVVQPGCLDALRGAAADHPDWAAWQALVLTPEGTVNTAGNVAHWTGLSWAGGHGTDPAAVGGDREVAFASGAALAVRRSAWDAVDGLAAQWFMYCEDLDLSLRLRLAGWLVGIVTDARVVHDYAFDKGAAKWFHLERNRWWTVLTTYPRPLLWRVLPALVGLELALVAVAAAGGWLPAKLRAQWAVLRALPMLRRRRRAVQASRRISVATFADGFSAALDSPFLGPAARARPLVAVQRTYWRLVRSTLPD